MLGRILRVMLSVLVLVVMLSVLSVLIVLLNLAVILMDFLQQRAHWGRDE